jgi:predicted O-methyltransferase YrrM
MVTMMKHYYKEIQHWFNYPEIFLEAIQNSNDGDHFVEIGVWKGGSAAFMGVEILNSGKKLRYDAIDCFVLTPEFWNTTEDIYEEAKTNLKPLTDLGVVNLIKSHSLDIVDTYKDGSLSLCFIDGSHRYQDVKDDIIAWLPKVKKGGILAGHDYINGNHPEVRIAADDVLGKENIIEKSGCYYYKK